MRLRRRSPSPGSGLAGGLAFPGAARRVHPRCGAGPADRGEPEPGGGQAQRDRAAQRDLCPTRRRACAGWSGWTRPRRIRQGAAMIGKISDPRGTRVRDLSTTCSARAGGRSTPTRISIAGWRHPAELEPPLRADGSRDFRRLTGLLQQPHAALGAVVSPVRCGIARSGPPRKTGCCLTMNGPRSPPTSCTAPASHHTAKTTTRSAGWPSGTAPTTSTSWPCWPARTAASPRCRMTTTGSARRAGPPRNATACGAPPLATGPRPGARPARSRRRPAPRIGQSRPASTLRRVVSTAAAGCGQRGAVLRPARRGRSPGS